MAGTQVPHMHRFRPHKPLFAGLPDERVKRLFQARVKSKWAIRKRSWAARHFRKSRHHPGGALLAALAEREFRKLIRSASFERILVRRVPRCGAIAGRCMRCRGKLVVGYEQWLGCIWTPFLDSAIDHEFTHCVQEVMADAISGESWGACPLTGFWVEIHAHLFGSPLILFSFLGVCAAFLLFCSRLSF